MSVVGKGCWKNREVGKLEIFKFENFVIGKNKIGNCDPKLEKSIEVEKFH